MTEKTILAIDVDQETEEKIVSTLEAEDYLVFAASGREITSGMAGRVSPALIFLKPTANSVEGFEICRTIHSSEAFKDVPIIVLASLKGPLDARYTSFYGIVDFLEMPVSPEAIIEKTEKILGGKSHDLQRPVTEEVMSIKEEIAPAEKTPVIRHEVPDYSDPLDKGPLDNDPLDKAFSVEEIGQPGEDYSYRAAEEEIPTRSLLNKGQRRPKKSGLMVPVLLVLAAVAIVAGGFVSYKLFFSPAGVRVPVKAAPSRAVQQKASQVPAPVAQQPKEQLIAEVKPTETKEAPQKAQQPLPQEPQQVSKQLPKQAPQKVPQKAPAVVPAAKPAAEQFYSVQLGAFKSEPSAEALAKKYKGKGHEAFTHKGTTKDNRPVYRVLVGKFKNRKEASQLAGKLQAGDKIKTTVYSEGGK